MYDWLMTLVKQRLHVEINLGLIINMIYEIIQSLYLRANIYIYIYIYISDDKSLFIYINRSNLTSQLYIYIYIHYMINIYFFIHKCN